MAPRSSWMEASVCFSCCLLLSLARGYGRDRRARVDDPNPTERSFSDETRVDVLIRPGVVAQRRAVALVVVARVDVPI